MAEIDNLEIQIKSSVKSANKSLDDMSKKLDEVATSMKNVLSISSGMKTAIGIDSKSLNEAKESLEALGKISKRTSNSPIKPKVNDEDIKKAAKSIDDLFDKFKTAGKGIDVSNLGFSELVQEAKKAEANVKRLNDRLEKKMSVEGTDNLGKSWENLVFDIQKATNQAEIYREAVSKIKRTQPEFTITRAEVPKADKKHSEEKGKPINAASFDYDSEAMKSVFGEGAEGLKNFSDVLEKFGWNASIASKKINEFEDNLNTKKIETYEYQIKEAKKALSDLASQGFREGDINYDEKAKELAVLTERQRTYNRENKKAAKSIIDDENITKTQKLSRYLKNATVSIKKFSTSFGKTISILHKFGKAVKSPIATLKKLKSAITGVQKQSSKGMSLGKMIGSSIAFSTVFQAISLIKQAIAEGSNNLTQYSAEYNNSISSMVSALIYLKNAWTSAFAPIINVVAPYVTLFINIISEALNKLGQFFSVLTGKTTAVQSKKVWKDYGASLEKVGSGASEAKKGLDNAAKAAEKFQDYTLGIDELNIQPQTENKDVNEGASGSDNNGNGSELLPSDMFETVEIESNISEFAQKVKEAWRNADFTEVGLIIGNKLKVALESIPWTEIQGTAWRIGKSLATLINGSVESERLGNTIGQTLGNAINTGIIGINAFLDNTHWDSVGQFIGNGLNGITQTIQWDSVGHMLAQGFNATFEMVAEATGTFDWTQLGIGISDGIVTAIEDFEPSYVGTSISNVVKGLLDLFIGFVQNTDWVELGSTIFQKLSDLFVSIDWSGIADRLFEGLGSALGGLAGFVWGIVKEAWGNVVEWWEENAFEDGKFTIFGLLDGILEAFSNIGKWIKDHIFQPFINGFKNVFGIHSPSTVMKEQGNYIMQGLFNGIEEMFNNVVRFFETLWESMKNVFSDTKEFFREKFLSAYNKVVEIFTPIASWFQNKWNAVKTALRDVRDFFYEKFLSAYNKVVEVFSPITSWFKRIWSAIKSVFFDLVDWFWSKFQSGYNAVTSVFSPITAWFRRIWYAVKSVFSDTKQFFKDAFQNAYDAVTRIWDGISGYFRKVANWIVSPIESAVNGVISGINWVFEAVGARAPLSRWYAPRFASGSNGLPSDTIGVVNDQAGSTYKELIVPPHGKPFIPEGRNVMLPMEKGTKIMPAGQTKALMNGMPKFKTGIGDFFGGMWEKFTNFTGDVLDYIIHPSKIVQIAIDKFTDLSNVGSFFIPLATGAINKLFDTVVGFVSRMFDKIGGAEKAVKWAIGIANDNSHGYDQASRWGNPDYDCSSLVISAFEQAGIKLKSAGATYTGNMYGAAKNLGFADVTGGVSLSSGTGMKRGDILLNKKNHAAIFIGNGQVVQASSNENGGIRGGRPGDQTGREINVSSYYNYPWDNVLRFVRKYKDGIGKISLSDLIPQYSVGGFPEDGLFMANHNELVGQFSDGRTAVANNLDIQKGIEDAAYRGFSRANAENREQENLLRELLQAVRDGKEIRIDGRTLVSITDSRRARNGYSFT